MDDIVKAVEMACYFGVPDSATIHRIVSEVRSLKDDTEKYKGSYESERQLTAALETKLAKVRELAESWEKSEAIVYKEALGKAVLEVLDGK